MNVADCIDAKTRRNSGPGLFSRGTGSKSNHPLTRKLEANHTILLLLKDLSHKRKCLKQITKSIRTRSKIFVVIRLAGKSYGRNKIVHQTIKIATASPSLVQAATAVIVAMPIVYCFLASNANDKNHPLELSAGAPQSAIERRGVTSTNSYTLSRKKDAEIRRGFNVAAIPADFDVPRLRVNVQSTAFELSATGSAVFSIDRHAKSYGIISKARSVTTGEYNAPSRHPEVSVDRIAFETPALAPMAFMRFCLKYPKDCEVRRMPFRPRPVALTAGRKIELATLNRSVNLAIRPKANNNGVLAEEWSLSPLEGDCNDYAVTKRHQLLARGWPSRTLLLAEVVIPSGEHHLVLIVRTRDDDLVLDNLDSNIRPISQVHHQWVRAQQEKNPKFWSAINVSRAARVAFNTR